MTNERVIKIAHVVAIAVFLLVAAVAMMAQPGQNSNQSGGQTGTGAQEAPALSSTERRFVTVPSRTDSSVTGC